MRCAAVHAERIKAGCIPIVKLWKLPSGQWAIGSAYLSSGYSITHLERIVDAPDWALTRHGY